MSFGQVHRLTQQFGRAQLRRVRRHHAPHPSTLRPMPPRNQVFTSPQPGVQLVRRENIPPPIQLHVVNIIEILGQEQTHTRRRQAIRIRRNVVRNLQHGRRAAPNRLKRSKQSEHIPPILIQQTAPRRRKAQRRRKPEILQDPPVRSRQQVRMTIHQPGKHHLPAPINTFRPRVPCLDLRARPNLRYPLPLHHKRSVIMNPTPRIARDDSRIRYQHTHTPTNWELLSMQSSKLRFHFSHSHFGGYASFPFTFGKRLSGDSSVMLSFRPR